MTTEILLKLSGLALLLSGILATVGLSVHPHDAAGSNHAMWLVAHVVVMSGALLNLLGLVGLYLRSARRLGLTGLIAFLLTTISLVLYLGKLYWSGFLYPLVIAHDAGFIRDYGFNPGSVPVDPVVRIVFYLGPILFALGYSLLGLGLLRLAAYPAAALWASVGTTRSSPFASRTGSRRVRASMSRRWGACLDRSALTWALLDAREEMIRAGSARAARRYPNAVSTHPQLGRHS